MTCPRSPGADYPVPFRLERDAGPRRYRLTNSGRETLDAVTLSLEGPGLMPASAPSTLRPAETLEVLISSRHLGAEAVLVVGWRRPSGKEYLWRTGPGGNLPE
jgi:hypothetical protein